MRVNWGWRAGVVAVALVLASALPAMAQAWTEYKNVEDGFSIVFPGTPTVMAITWKTQLGFMLPARIYSAERQGGRFTVTVVDYAGIEAQAKERIKTCDPGSDTCLGSRLSGEAYWRHEVRGALLDATFRFLKRGAELTHLQWNHMDLVEGHMLSLTDPKDGARTYAFVAMREMKLYIIEGTVPKNAPEPGLFQQSLGWVEKDGTPIRYETIYSNQFHGLKQYPAPANTRATPARR